MKTLEIRLSEIKRQINNGQYSSEEELTSLIIERENLSKKINFNKNISEPLYTVTF